MAPKCRSSRIDPLKTAQPTYEWMCYSSWNSYQVKIFGGESFGYLELWNSNSVVTQLGSGIFLGVTSFIKVVLPFFYNTFLLLAWFI